MIKKLALQLWFIIILVLFTINSFTQYSAGDTIQIEAVEYRVDTIEAEWNATNETPIEGRNVPVELDGRIVIGNTKTGSVLGYPVHVGAEGGSFIFNIEYKGFTGFDVDGYINLWIDDEEPQKIKLDVEGWNIATSKSLLLSPGFHMIYTQYKGNSGTFNIDRYMLNAVPGILKERESRQISALDYDPDTIHTEDYDPARSSITAGKCTIEGENPAYVSNIQDNDMLSFPVDVGAGGGLFNLSYVYIKLTNDAASIQLYLDDTELETISLSTNVSTDWEAVTATSGILLSPGYHEIVIKFNGSGSHIADFFVLSPVENSLETSHPRIFVNAQEKSLILDKIEKYDWAETVFSQIENNVTSEVYNHVADPEAILMTIPDFGVPGNHDVLQLGLEAGILYFLTSDADYAQFSADILSYYCTKLAEKSPETTTILGDDFQDGRQTYPHLALMYDFIYGFIKSTATTVYDIESGSRLPFDHVAAQKALKNMAGNMLQEYGDPDTYGRRVSNHHILQAPGALFPILCVEDEAERERLFNVFWEIGSKHQGSFTKTVLPMYLPQGIWPESVSYSFMPHVPMILNIVDRIKPELNVAGDYKHVLEGSLIFPQLKNPNGTYVRYGDSKRLNENSDEFYRFIMHMASRNGYDDLNERAEITLKHYYNSIGGYDPAPQNNLYDHGKSLELFWGMQIPDTVVGKVDHKPTIIIKHAGVALQRNFVEQDNELYGLNGYIGGAHYVHSHCTGIAMELYGAGYVMGPNGGLPRSVAQRGDPDHTDYFRLYAGNNTVIVNGTSHGKQSGAWKNSSEVWQNTTVNVASEPLHKEDPISESFSFATQFLNDDVNNCDQQRTLSVIRTSPTTAYYFDMFRSKSNVENNFHDYIYHNLGDETTISNNKGEAYSLSSTNMYDNDIGDVVHSPGWRFFENEQVTSPTSDEVRVRFHIAVDNRYMHLFVPGGVEREYTRALAPPTREARNGYVSKKTQVVAIRQQGEAWNRPYISVFEPSTGADASVQSTEHLVFGELVVGARIVSNVGASVFTDYIISLPTPDSIALPALGITFKGRFGIVRKEHTGDTEKVTLYIGEGEELTYADTTLMADELNQGLKVYEHDPVSFFSIDITSENGSVSISPEQTEYVEGTEISLTATADEGFRFDGWTGDVSDTVNPLRVTMDSDKSITANFSLLIGISPPEDQLNFSVYPNPSNGSLQVNLSAPANGNFTIHNSFGRIVEEGRITQQFRIDLSSCSQGVYFLKLKTGSEMMVKKVVLSQ